MSAISTELTRILINPSGTEEFYNTWQYSQAVRVGDTLWAAGQMGIGPEGQTGTTLEEQSRFALQNLVRVLEDGGASLADIVELTSYHVDIEALPTFARVKAEFIPQDFPAWTAVEVTKLALPGLLIEVKATAVCGSAGARGNGGAR